MVRVAASFPPSATANLRFSFITHSSPSHQHNEPSPPTPSHQHNQPSIPPTPSHPHNEPSIPPTPSHPHNEPSIPPIHTMSPPPLHPCTMSPPPLTSSPSPFHPPPPPPHLYNEEALPPRLHGSLLQYQHQSAVLLHLLQVLFPLREDAPILLR